MSPKNFPRKRVRDPICRHLRQLISPYGFGFQEPRGVGRYSNEQLIRWYNAHGFMGSPSNGALYAHFAGQTTYYFWADGRKNTRVTLTCIDIDCHGRGTAESARAFADWLAGHHFPGLYHEPSTHGTGRHGYIVLEKLGYGDREVDEILRVLDRALKKLLRVFLAENPEHQVENVEIVGTPHVITWKRGEGRQIESMRSGRLAKIPREILDRFEEFRDTTRLDFSGILDLAERAGRMEVRKPEALAIFVPKAAVGSLRTHPVPRDEIEALHGPYLEFARAWIPGPLETTGSRAKVEAIDLAIALAVLKVCTGKPNADGTMPTARIKKIWDGLCRAGEIARSFDYHRWKVVRDLIETRGGLVMVDRRYYSGFVNDQGEVIPGLAAKWHLAPWLVETLDGMAVEGYSKETEGAGTGDGEEILIPWKAGGGALLEQGKEEDEGMDPEKDWIVEFRQSWAPEVGLIWAGTVDDFRREAG